MGRVIRALVAFAVAVATLFGGVAPVAAAVPDAGSGAAMEHEGPAPLKPIRQGQKVIPVSQVTQESRLHGVYDLAASRPASARVPDDARFTSWKPLRSLLTRLVDTKTEPPEREITGTVDFGSLSLFLQWDDQNPSKPEWDVDTFSDVPLTFPVKVNYTIQGRMTHAPGSVQFTVPLSLFENSNHMGEGTIEMSMPESPNPDAQLTFKRLADKIVVTNNKTLPATYQGYFEFAYIKVVPHELATDLGTKDNPYKLTAKAVSDSSGAATKSSNTLTATVTTHEEVDNAHKQGDTDTEKGDVSISRPLYTNLDPTRQYEDPSAYWFVNWYMWAHVRGNRRFALSVKDTPSNAAGGGHIIGSDLPGVVPSSVSSDGSLSVSNVFSGFVESGDNFYYHVTMAYPRRELNSLNRACNGSGALKWITEQNSVIYTLTPANATEQKDITTQTASASQKNTKYPFCTTGHVFNIFKHGPKDYDSSTTRDKSRYPAGSGENDYGLNRLRSGQDLHVQWSVSAFQYNFGDTFTGLDRNDPANYGKIAVRTLVQDDQQWFDRPKQSDPILTGSEATIESLDFIRPTVLDYKTDPSSQYGYSYYASPKDAPDTTVQARVNGSTWETVGLVSYKNGSVQVGNPQNGASVDVQTPARLKLPSGTTAWRVFFTSKNAGEDFYVDENVAIHPAGRIPQRVKDLFKNSSNPNADVANDVKMGLIVNPKSATDLPGLDNCQVPPDKPGSGISSGCAHNTAVQQVQGGWQRVSMSKQGWQTGNDPVRQAANIRYQMRVRADTNITSRTTLEKLVKNGVFPSDSSARFYDLLPPGIRPDLSSVTASGGTVTNVRLMEDWRGSGRQMLIVDVSGRPSEGALTIGSKTLSRYRILRFDSTYSTLDSLARAKVQKNIAAYVSDCPQLGTVPGYMSEGDHLDPSWTADKYKNDGTYTAVHGFEKQMTNLEPQNSGKVSTLYASNDIFSITPLTYAGTGLNKQVASESGGEWTHDSEPGITVAEGSAYRYRLSEVGSVGNTKINHIILADNLEAYDPSDPSKISTTNWHGTLVGVDTSALRAQGIAPVVWYRTSPFDTSRAPTLSVSDGWTQAKPGDMSQVKAVAVDCSKKADGSDYVLPSGRALEVELLMRAPYGAAAGSVPAGGKATYNDVWMSSKVDGRAQWLEHSYTKVMLVPFSVRVVKTWDDDDDRDALRPTSVEVNLVDENTGKTIGGPETLSPSNNWSYTFTDLPAADENGNTIDYKIKENNVPGYTAFSQVSQPDSTGRVTVTLTNTHTPEKITLTGEKVWRGGSAPSSLVLRLWSDDGSSAGLVDTGRTKRVSPVAGSWSWTWPGLYRYRNVGGKAVPVKYAVSEAAPEGWKPVDDKGNQLDASHLYPADQKTGSTGRMVNVWHPFGDLSLTKSVTDAQGPARDATFTFTLGLTRLDGSPDPGVYRWVKKGGVCDTTPTDSSCSGQVSNGQTVTLKAGQTVTVREVPMGERYVWTETAVKGFHTGAVLNGSGVVKANATAAATVENVYRSQGFGYVKAVKSLVGRPLHALQFGFTLRPVTGVGENGAGGTVGDIVGQAWNEADGSVDFPAIAYSQADAGKTFWYQLVETSYDRPGYTSDHTVYRVKMTVVDKGDGTMGVTPTYYTYDPVKQQLAPTDAQGSTPPTFKNVYKATGTLRLAVQKVFVGGSLADKHFTFHLSGGGLDEDSPQTDSSGVTWFDIPYTEKQAYTGSTNGRTFSYTIREKNDGDKTIVWDSHSETVTVKVTDNGDGTLSMDETYADTVGDTPLVWRNKAGNGSLRITKYLATDAQTQAHKDTDFPMRIYLTAPAGGTLPTTLTVMFHKADTDHNSTAGNVSTPWTVKLNKDKTSGTVDVKVHGNSWIQLNGIPGGASYQVVEEDN